MAGAESGGMRDDASGKPIEAALDKIDGVKTVALYPKQHTAAILFTSKGGVTDGQSSVR